MTEARRQGSAPARRRTRPPPGRAATARPLAELENDAILAALREHEGNRSRAADALGISRTTLWRKLRELQ